MLKNYYKALNYILVKLSIVKIVIGQLRVKMTMFTYYNGGWVKCCKQTT